MRVTLPAALLAAILFSTSGCSICAPGYLDDYAAVGGKWQRDNPTQGRVGSILSDPYAGTTTVEGDSDEIYYEMDDDSVVQGNPVSTDEVYYDDSPEPAYETPADDGVIILGESW